MLAFRVAFAALSTLVVSDTTYPVTWRTSVGQVSDYRIQATGKVNDKSIKAIANLRVEVRSVAQGKATSLILSTSSGAISTPQGRTELPGQANVSYAPQAVESPDAPGLGIFANVPMFLFQTVSGSPVRVGQAWKKGGALRLRAEALEPVGATKAMRIALTSDPKGADQIDGTYWISTQDGAVLKASIHTKTQISSDEEEAVPAEWTITIDRLSPTKEKTVPKA